MYRPLIFIKKALPPTRQNNAQNGPLPFERIRIQKLENGRACVSDITEVANLFSVEHMGRTKQSQNGWRNDRDRK